MNYRRKLNRLRVSNSALLPADCDIRSYRELMIYLGWVRLLHTICSKADSRYGRNSADMNEG
jgi:hypothetical protein